MDGGTKPDNLSRMRSVRRKVEAVAGSQVVDLRSHTDPQVSRHHPARFRPVTGLIAALGAGHVGPPRRVLALALQHLAKSRHDDWSLLRAPSLQVGHRLRT